MKGNDIYWDLDGVLRDLCKVVFGGHADVWDQKTESGKDLIETVDDDLDLLRIAPVSEYIEIAQLCDPIHIITVQPDHWRKYTTNWIDHYFKDAKVKFLNKPEDKLKFIVSGTRTLIEDYPLFSCYDNIILIDRPYNRNVKGVLRVSSPLGLMNALRRKHENLEGD
jgi:hypothetical protein